MTAVIAPMRTTRTVECIVQDGIKYCEQIDFPDKELGVILLGFFAYICWFFFWAWYGEKKDSMGIALGLGLIAPLLSGLLIGGIILIL